MLESRCSWKSTRKIWRPEYSSIVIPHWLVFRCTLPLWREASRNPVLLPYSKQLSSTITSRNGYRPEPKPKSGPEFGQFGPANQGLTNPPSPKHLGWIFSSAQGSGPACLRHFWVASEGCPHCVCVNRKWCRGDAGALASLPVDVSMLEAAPDATRK